MAEASHDAIHPIAFSLNELDFVRCLLLPEYVFFVIMYVHKFQAC
jgi:hypothetical protein